MKPFVENGNIHEIVDNNLGSNYNLENVQKVAKIALMNVNGTTSIRPNMSVVVGEL